MPPMSEDFAGNLYVLGTDGAGRDMLSAIFYGLRVSLGVGVLSGVFALIIGSIFGIGFFKENFVFYSISVFKLKIFCFFYFFTHKRVPPYIITFEISKKCVFFKKNVIILFFV